MRNLTHVLFSILLFCFYNYSATGQSCLPTGFSPTTQAEIDNFQTTYPGCTVIEGNVYINGTGINNLNGLSVVTEVKGNLEIANTTIITLQGLNNLTKVGGKLGINNISTLTSLSGLNKLDSVGGYLDLTNLSNLAEITDLINLEYIGTLYIADCDLLADLTGLNNVKTVRDWIGIFGNDNLSSLTGLDHFIDFYGGSFDIGGNPLLSVCDVQAVCDIISVLGLAADISNNATGCNSWTEVDAMCLADATAAALADRGKGVAINTDGSKPDSSAILDVQGSALAMAIPRLSPTEIRALIDPKPGMTVYDKGRRKLYYYDGTSWIPTDEGMGDHNATMNLEMNQFDIKDVRRTVSKELYVDDIGIIKKLFDKDFDEGNPAQILSSTGTGTDWIDPPMADNLGNHIATQDLNLYGHDIALNFGWLSGDGDEEGVFVGPHGNVGIGVANPDANLQIGGTLGSGTNHTFSIQDYPNIPFVEIGRNQSNKGSIYWWDDYDAFILKTIKNGSIYDNTLVLRNGNVGIGTPIPAVKLQIGNTLGATANHQFSLQDYPNYPFFNIGSDANNKAEIFWWDDNDALSFRTTDNGTLYNYSLVLKNGKIGINNYLPTESLDVSGTVKMTGFKLTPTAPVGHVLTSDGTQGIWQAPVSSADNLGDHTATQNLSLNNNWLSGDGNNEGVFVNSNGNVGINTNSPSEILDVNGTVRMSSFKTNPMGPAGHILTSDGVSGIWQAPTPSMDNLGDHIATQNIRLNSNWLSGDGDPEGVYIDSDGKVGIGTSFPLTRLHVMKSSSGAALVNSSTLLVQESIAGADANISIMGSATGEASVFFGDENGNAIGSIIYSNNSDMFTFKTGGVNHMFLNDQGHLGIGNSNPTASLDVSGTMKLDIPGKAEGKVLGSTDNMGNTEWVDPSDGDWEYSGDNLYGLLSTSANLGIGTDSPIRKVHIKQGGPIDGILLEYSSDTDYWSTYIDSNDDYNFAYNNSLKSYIDDSDGSYNIASDKRLKEKITPYPLILSKALLLNPVKYRFKNTRPTNKLSTGLIAQEVQQLFPETVTEKNGYLSINYDAFAVIAIKAIQEQQEIIDEQQKTLDELIRRIEILEHK